ncbi:MAG: PfkB family carbohydrate kinase [Rhodothermales bacterium]
MSILAIGTVAFDSIETPYGSADRVLGGSATYITLAARFFCEPVRLVGVVGADFPEPYIEALRGCGVDLDGLEVDRGGETFAWAGRYHDDMNGRDTLATHLNVLQTFSPKLPPRFRDSRIVCLGNLDPTIQMQVLDQMESPDLVICDTMNFWIDHTPDALQRLLGRIDCLMINDEEARQLAGESNLLLAARAIMAKGPRILVIKKGEHGAIVVDDESVFAFPAFPLERIQDPTGAGDTFMGGFAGYLTREGRYTSDSIRRAILYGSALASFTVERFGPERLLHLQADEINERVAAYRRITHLPEILPLPGSNGSGH